MIFVLDVGNTNTVLGVYDGDELKFHWRIETSRSKTEDEYGMIVKMLLQDVGLHFLTLTASLFLPLFRQLCLR